MRDNRGQSPLHRACIGGHIETVQYPVESANCNVGEYVTCTLFFDINYCSSNRSNVLYPV